MTLSSVHHLNAVSVVLFLHLSAGQEIQLNEIADESTTFSRANNPNAVANLNRFTFHGNVMKQLGENSAAHWIVMFCPPWWEMCQRMVEPFASMSSDWQSKLNNQVFTSNVRFASVDCATDKPLCNEQEVEGYPTVHHYTDGQRVATWNGGRKNDPETLAKWVKSQMDESFPLDEFRQSSHANVQSWSGAMLTIRQTLALVAPGDCALDLCLIFGILALLSRTICSNPKVWQTHARTLRASTKSVSGSTEEAVDPVEVECTSVSRFLPHEWARARTSIEL